MSWAHTPSRACADPAGRRPWNVRLRRAVLARADERMVEAAESTFEYGSGAGLCGPHARSDTMGAALRSSIIGQTDASRQDPWTNFPTR